MISKLLSFAAIVAAVSASCPNDCSHHGLCNQYSACECYRNYMGADCSQRVCPFGHSFVDTPQGDLNADGKVDRPDIYYLKVDTGVAISNDNQDMMFPANTMIFDGTLATASPSLLMSLAVSVESVAAVKGTTNWEFSIPVTIHDRVPQANVNTIGSGNNGAIACAPVAFVEDQQIAACEGFVTGDDIPPTYMRALSWESNVYTYNTQFTNAKTWELYPVNHAKGKKVNELSRTFSEAHFYSECSGKGLCNRESGQCECYPGYEGVGCTRTSCPNACSGHGVCQRISDVTSSYYLWDRKKTQVCTCDSGYTGIDCSQRICPSGNDPITRPTSQSSTTDNAAYFHLLPHSDGDEPEIQTFGYITSLQSGDFALEFTDEFGDKWTTKTMDFLTATAKNVEEALEALPNHVVQDVHVSYRFLNDMVYYDNAGTETAVDYTGCSLVDTDDDEITDSNACHGLPRMFQITFVTNSGNIANLGVRYSVTDASGATESDTNGAFTQLATCGDGTLQSSETVSCVFDGYGQATRSMADVIEAIGFEGTIEAALAGLTDDYATLNARNAGVYYSGHTDSRMVVANTGRTGSQENQLCSNRGICDYSTGLCSCFNGFTDDDCSVQNALAMY